MSDSGRKRKGKNFVGDKKNQRFVETVISHIMKEIDDSIEKKKTGFTIRKCVANYKVGLDGDGEPSKFGPLDWLTEAQIYGVRKRAKKRKLEKERKEAEPSFSIKCPSTGRELFPGRSFDTDSGDEEELRTNFVTPHTNSKSIGGRKKGSTKLKSEYEEEKIRMLKNDISLEWAKVEVSETDKRSLFEVINWKKAEYNLPHVRIPESTIRSRVRRNSLTPRSRGPISPMAAIEPTLVHIIKYAASKNQHLSQEKVLQIANELIKGTSTEDSLAQVLSYTHPQGLEKGEVKVGWNWYRQFSRRYKEISSTYIKNVNYNRQSYTTFSYMWDMYDMIYKQLHKWGHTKKLDCPEWQDIDGNKVYENDSSRVGYPVEYELLYPYRCLTMDETGDNTNQSDDRFSRRNKYVHDAGAPPPKKASATNDCHFTTQGFTTLSGEAVLGVVIIKKGSKLNFEEKFGVDLTVPFIDEDGNEVKDYHPDWQELDEALLERNQGLGRRWPGPISCFFRGVEIPSLIVSSKSGGVTPEILVLALEHLDKHGVFPRYPSMPDPVLLLDGHSSRLAKPFLQYINNLDSSWEKDRAANHKWLVAIGLPYATGQWQVGDSPQANGAYKYYCLVKKEQMRDNDIKVLKKDPSLKRYCIVPIFNSAFAVSFQNKKSIKKAVAQRGWGPLNKNCLLNPEIQRTKVAGAPGPDVFPPTGLSEELSLLDSAAAESLRSQSQSSIFRNNLDNAPSSSQESGPGTQESDITLSPSASQWSSPAEQRGTPLEKENPKKTLSYLQDQRERSLNLNLSRSQREIIEQGDLPWSAVNFGGEATQELFNACKTAEARYINQQREIRERREKQKQGNVEINGKITSGKLYELGIINLDNPILLNYFKNKHENEIEEGYEMKLKRFKADTKIFEEGEKIVKRIGIDKLENAKELLNQGDLKALVRWKWLGYGKRPLLSTLKPRTTDETNRDAILRAWDLCKFDKNPHRPQKPVLPPPTQPLSESDDSSSSGLSDGEAQQTAIKAPLSVPPFGTYGSDLDELEYSSDDSKLYTA